MYIYVHYQKKGMDVGCIYGQKRVGDCSGGEVKERGNTGARASRPSMCGSGTWTDANSTNTVTVYIDCSSLLMTDSS